MRVDVRLGEISLYYFSYFLLDLSLLVELMALFGVFVVGDPYQGLYSVHDMFQG